MLLYFHQFQQLIEVIKSENKALIGKVMKSTWLFNEIVKNFTPEELVNDFFKHTSYSTRMKILNKLTKCTVSDDYASRLFEVYSKKYGIHSAKHLLPLFSSEKIKDILSSNELNMSTCMLKKLIDKDPTLVTIFWAKHKDTIIPFVAKRDVMVLWKFVENETCNIELGRQTTNKLIQKYKEYIIRNPEKCIENLKLREVIKRLGDSYREMFGNWFAHEFIDSDNLYYDIEGSDLAKYLKHLDKQRQMALFTDVYIEVFKKAPFEDIDKINIPLALSFITDINKRNALAEEKYNNDKQKNDWVCYMTVEKSIPLLKEKLRFLLISLLDPVCSVCW